MGSVVLAYIAAGVATAGAAVYRQRDARGFSPAEWAVFLLTLAAAWPLAALLLTLQWIKETNRV